MMLKVLVFLMGGLSRFKGTQPPQGDSPERDKTLWNTMDKAVNDSWGLAAVEWVLMQKKVSILPLENEKLPHPLQSSDTLL